MTTLAEVEAAALALPPEELEELRDRLGAAGATGPDDPCAEGEGELGTRLREAERRLEAYRRGQTTAQDWRTVIAELRERASARGGARAA